MIQEEILTIYNLCEKSFYQSVCREELSLVEAISLDIIYVLRQPTIAEYARFMDISQPNATYRINQLIRKGYLIKQQSQEDHRVSYLIVTEKYHSAYDKRRDLLAAVCRALDESDPEQVEAFGLIVRNIKERLENDQDHH